MGVDAMMFELLSKQVLFDISISRLLFVLVTVSN